jgi:hypothetical protein
VLYNLIYKKNYLISLKNKKYIVIIYIYNKQKNKMMSISQIKFMKDKLSLDIKQSNIAKTKLEGMINDHKQILVQNEEGLELLKVELVNLENLKL